MADCKHGLAAGCWYCHRDSEPRPDLDVNIGLTPRKRTRDGRVARYAALVLDRCPTRWTQEQALLVAQMREVGLAGVIPG